VDLASNFKAAFVDIIEVFESESENESEKLVIISCVFCDLLLRPVQMQAVCLHLKITAQLSQRESNHPHELSIPESKAAR
jgi:hypothetical protein